MKNVLKISIAILCVILLMNCKNQTKTTENQAVEKTVCNEPHRPQFHFSPPEKWMNDPNGMVYYEGEYHLFYQHFPDSNIWGPMHWGHAVSTDLVHWKHLPIALYPDSLGLIFSGSAVIDWKNTTGFGTKEKPAMVAIYTNHDMKGEQNGKHNFQTQSIAYSNDKGRTWTKYNRNPILPNSENIHDFRDPKVSWHEARQKWVMILAANDKVKIYNSDDLKTWQFASDFGFGHGSQARPWECPDLFEMTLKNGEKKWVMIVSIGNRIETQAPNGGSGTMYFVGDFDGKTFTNSQPKEKTLWIDYGRDNYAGVTYSDIPQNDGRRLFIGWMSNWQYATVVPTEKWRSAVTISRELTLHQTADGYLIYSQPLKELEKLRYSSENIAKTTIHNKLDLSEKTNAAQSEWILEFEPNEKTTSFGVELSNEKGDVYKIGFDVAKNEFFSDRTKAGKVNFSDQFAAKIHTAPRISADKTIKFHLFLDAASAELFADNGATVLTDIFFPNEDFKTIKVFTNDGTVTVSGFSYDLKSIW
jgi:fructan beta-fructosidase